MLRASYVSVLLLLAVIIASAAMPASAHINLLQNPGFETGSFAPWEIGGTGAWEGRVQSGGAHGGTYSAYIKTAIEADAGIWQMINPPRCAAYLEFWYRGDGPEVNVYYSDDTMRMPRQFLSYTSEWAFVHVDLDTSKLVEQAETWGYSHQSYMVDDFDLEACAAPPVGGELLTPTPVLSPVMLIAVIAAASVIALGYRFTRR